jgi:hypothetical protein
MAKRLHPEKSIKKQERRKGGSGVWITRFSNKKKRTTIRKGDLCHPLYPRNMTEKQEK